MGQFESPETLTPRRLTDAFSKKIEEHAAAVSLHVACYTLGGTDQTLSKTGWAPRDRHGGRVETHPWSTFQIAQLLD